MTAHDEPTLKVPSLHSPTGQATVKLGDPIAIEFPDGKGVSARIASVDIEAGGERFSIHCNPDGSPEDLECTCPPNGIEALTLANADLIRERDHLRERNAVLRAQYESAQAASDNWEGMYRSLAEMTREPEPHGIDSDGRCAECEPENVGGEENSLDGMETVNLSELREQTTAGERLEFLPITVADGMVTINLSVYRNTP